jgi:osomolarity two-component system phosphorelay intermediate protein YPD1
LDFADMARLGHFLKGSSAALGLVRIKGSCERLQHHGEFKDAAGVAPIPQEEAEDLIQALLAQMRDEYDEAKEHLDAFYSAHQSQDQNPDQD